MREDRERIETGIYRRRGGYEIAISVQNKFHSIRLPEGSTLRDARAKRAELQHRVNRGEAIAPARLTTDDLLDRWLIDLAQTAKSQGTRLAYRLDASYWHRTIGTMRVRRLTGGDVEHARDELLSTLSPKSVRNALGTLKVCLNWAVRHELVGRNVAADVKPPAVERFESHWAGREEAGRLLAAFEEAGPPYGTMLAIALLTCLRVESEWGGMRWRDVDLTKGTAALTHVRLQDGAVVLAGNNKHKRRSIPLSPDTIRILRVQERWQTKMREANSGAWVDTEGFVFTGPHGDRIRQSTLKRNLERLCGAASVPRMRVHDLRHTGATLLLAAGVHAKVVSDMLGHSSIKITLDTYGHAVPGLAEAAANQLGELLRPLPKSLPGEDIHAQAPS